MANVNPMIFTLFVVVTPHCTFRNAAGGAVVVTTWMVLRRSPSMEEFVNAFKEAVLPLGNCLRAISEGSIRFTLQAENISAMKNIAPSFFQWVNSFIDEMNVHLRIPLVALFLNAIGGQQLNESFP